MAKQREKENNRRRGVCWRTCARMAGAGALAGTLLVRCCERHAGTWRHHRPIGRGPGALSCDSARRAPPHPLHESGAIADQHAATGGRRRCRAVNGRTRHYLSSYRVSPITAQHPLPRAGSAVPVVATGRLPALLNVAASAERAACVARLSTRGVICGENMRRGQFAALAGSAIPYAACSGAKATELTAWCGGSGGAWWRMWAGDGCRRVVATSYLSRDGISGGISHADCHLCLARAGRAEGLPSQRHLLVAVQRNICCATLFGSESLRRATGIALYGRRATTHVGTSSTLPKQRPQNDSLGIVRSRCRAASQPCLTPSLIN